jgi:formylglycine-generating enzyme required for sulfatase activity
MGTNPSYFRSADLPVEQVSWYDCQTFLQRMNARNDGYRYRLPTEAEWEYAARAGSTDKYAGGILDEIAWTAYNSGLKTHPVGGKRPNAWGLYDMLGNVFERVQDWYSAGYYSISPMADPPGPSSGVSKVHRGASWSGYALHLRVSYKDEYSPDGKFYNVGFRCVRETTAP